MKVNVCLVQDNPVFFDKEKTIDKMEGIIEEQARNGAKLIVFPESFIPGYPRGFSFGTVVGRRSTKGRELFAEYYKNSVSLEGNSMNRLLEMAKRNDVYLCVGITEKVPTNKSLYCSMVYISPSSGLLGVHRKIKPTGTERLIWAESDGTSLTTFDTKIGKLGGLICWENYMPLARMSMYQKGVEIYIAPTADSRKTWTATMQQIALEGRCYVLGCNQYFTKSMYPKQYQHLVKDEVENMCEGGSVIVAPSGEILSGPLLGTSGNLIAELDLDEIQQNKLDFDVVGHYARDDIFSFKVVSQPEIKREE